MSILKEFRDFAVRGNVVDMAVGIIIGAAFGKIVSSLVSDVIMPPIGMIIGGVDFTGLQVTLKAAEGAVPAVTLKYGAFLQQVFDFTIVAFAMFALIKGITQLKKREAAAAPLPTGQEVLLAEIRDILKSKSA
jgi:large conductance mechanosensitive channel